MYFETKVGLCDTPYNTISNENQYPVFRGLTEQTQFDGIFGKPGQVPDF